MKLIEDFIHIRGAKTHNLKNISVDIPRNKLVVITGLSGSGKSSLAFDTLYAEGQRRYVESLSSYARQFLGRMQKPEVDFIDGIPPAIAIQQKVTSRNPRSTVGTTTEIYDYLKLLFARIGRTISPVSGQEVKRHTIRDVVDFIMSMPIGEKAMLLSPIHLKQDVTLGLQLDIWADQGFSRLFDPTNGQTVRINDTNAREDMLLIIDRIVADGEKSTANRLADSVQTAFFEGEGECIVYCPNQQTQYTTFSQHYEMDGITFMEPSEHLFDFNSPLGACTRCGGTGMIHGIDRDLVVPNKQLSIYEGAIACWRGETMGAWNQQLILNAEKFGFPIHTPFYALTDEQKHLIWTGNEYFRGLNDFFDMLDHEQGKKMQYRITLSRYKGKTRCPDCEGTRLRREALYVQVGGKNMAELISLPISDLQPWFAALPERLNETEQLTAAPLLKEISSRLTFMHEVGLSYLTLSRLTASLSGGESQRINLAKSLGSSLVGSLYVLDEPSIGLHPRDTVQLIHVLKQLRDLGNTVVVVEHDEDIMRAADYIIDIGPEAGRNGGQVVVTLLPEETPKDMSMHSYTLDFLQGKERIPVPKFRRPWNNYIELIGACENNLKNLTVRFPLHVLTCITGVSGSGKSSLVTKVLYPALKKYYGGIADHTGDYGAIKGSLGQLTDVEFVDQNPLSRSSRSNPVTYLKAYDEIRKLYAEQQLSKQMGYTPAHFSFNTPGGRCEECQGEGFITIEMQFMADIVMECEHCHGQRFNKDILDVRFRGKNIFDVLEMTIEQAMDFFQQACQPQEHDAYSREEINLCKRIIKRLKPLMDVGIGYVKLGQSSSTLSGGESQRVKLASFLAQEGQQPTLFIFDEPTTGLHYHDIAVLLKAIHSLIEKGHTVIIIEHNPAVIMAADHVIDLGPEGGSEGGNIVFEGTPEGLMKCTRSHTGQSLFKTLQHNDNDR